MRRKAYPASGPLFEKLFNWVDPFMKNKVSKINDRFNRLTTNTKRASVIVFGILMGILCTSIITRSFHQRSDKQHIEKITLPNDINMKSNNAQDLTPVGKMKGEIDGEFESFYIAVDAKGQLFTNRDPEYSENRYRKSNGWEPITRRQLEAFEKELHFIPHQKKGLRK
jgi:hypothetical protein